MYYQLYGSGSPVLLLHGGFNTVEETFPRQLGPLSATHLLIAPEQQGHGRTPDIDAPLDYVDMADKTAELLKRLALGRVDVLGLSDGGIVGLLLASRHPGLVRHLAVTGASTLPLQASFTPDVTAEAQSWDPATDTAGMARYRREFADPPAHYQVIVAKLKELWLRHPTDEELGPAVLHRIRAPTMVMAGDHDGVLLEHTIAIWRNIDHAELFIVPGTSHNTLGEHPEWLNPMVEAFFASPAVGR
jgi:pimeloyl-ACP methyl ester carboxylesterase